MTGAEVVLSGTGAVSAAGLGSEALWRAVSAGTVVTGPVSRFDTTGFGSSNAGEVPAGSLTAMGPVVTAHPSAAARYLAAAVVEAVGQASLRTDRRGTRAGFFVGTVMGTRPILEHGPAGAVDATDTAEWAAPERLLEPALDLVPVTGPVVLLASGCSVGGEAIARGAAAVAAGEVDVALCGGAEELAQEVCAMFTSLRALAPQVARPFDTDRRGMQPAEGAGVLVLESAAHCAARGGRPLAGLLGWSSAAEAYHLTSPQPSGETLARALLECLKQSGRTADEVDWVCAHGTGTRAGDAAEARAIDAALGTPGRRPVVSSLKGGLGHAQGAAAVLEAIVAVQALGRGWIPGTATLRRPDPAFAALDLVRPPGRKAAVCTVASLAFGLGGGVSALLLGTGGRR